jgi:hypothetical protein
MTDLSWEILMVLMVAVWEVPVVMIVVHLFGSPQSDLCSPVCEYRLNRQPIVVGGMERRLVETRVPGDS